MICGVSKRPFHPPVGIPMGGHPGWKRAREIRDPLCVRAATFEAGGCTAAIVSVDLLFIDRRLADQVRFRVRQDRDAGRSRLDPDQLYLCATHTHSGPLTTPLFGSEEEQDLNGLVAAAIGDCLLDAQRHAVQARLRTSHRPFPGWSFCERIRMHGGRIETHPFKDDPAILAPEGIPDPSLVCLSIRDTRNRLLGVLYNYANHPQVLSRRDDRLSADFPGETEARFNDLAGQDVPLLFLNGACGDVCPVDAMNPAANETGEAHLARMGAALAEALVQLVSETDAPQDGTSPDDRIVSRSWTGTLPLRAVPPRLEPDPGGRKEGATPPSSPPVSDYGTEASQAAAEAGILSLEQYLGHADWIRQEESDRSRMRRALRENPGYGAATLSALCLGGATFLFHPFEMFAGLALDIREQAPVQPLFLVELCNDQLGYLPTPAAFLRPGGYETRTLQTSRFAPEAGDRVVDEARELLQAAAVASQATGGAP